MKQIIFFLSVFLSTFLLLMFYDKWKSAPAKKNVLKEVMNAKVEQSEINGVKVLARNGMKNLSLNEFLGQIKSGLQDANGRVVHESSKGDRHFITYLSDNQQHSFILQATSAKTCRYMHFTTQSKEIPQYEKEVKGNQEIPMPANAEIVLNMNGEKGKSLISFLTDLNAAEVELFYVHAMMEAGWRREDVAIPKEMELPEEQEKGVAKSLYFMKDKTPMVINIMNDPSTNALMVFIIKG